MKLTISIFLIAVVSPSYAQTGTPQCSIPAFDSKKADDITAAYSAKFKEAGDEVQRDGDKISEDGSDARVTGHFETRRLDYKLDVPEVTFKDKAMALDLPQITSKIAVFSYDFVETRVENTCRGGPDRITTTWKVCDKDTILAHPCSETRTTRGPDLCTPTTVRMKPRRQEIKLTVPEVKMVRKDFVLKVPNFVMKTQAHSFDYPVYIIDSIQTRGALASKRGAILQSAAETRFNVLNGAMTQEIKDLARVPLERGYECQLKTLESVFNEQAAVLEIGDASVAAGLKIAKERGVDSAVEEFEKAAAEQRKARDEIADDLAKKKDEAKKQFESQLAAL